MTAHSYFMKAEGEADANNGSGALNYYKKAFDIFSAELHQSPHLPNREVWEKELVLIDRKIKAIQKAPTLSLPTSSFDSFHPATFEELILSMRHVYPKTGVWSPNVIGLDSVKQVLDRLLIPHTREEIWQVDEKPPQKALLYGAPGCGKTHIVKDFSQKTGLPLYDIIPAKVISKYVGESEKILTSLFRKAYREEDGCILFFDEFDALIGRSRTDSEALVRVKQGLLTLIDGIDVPPKNKTIIIALTNRPDLLGGAMMRRFDFRIYVPPPDYDTISLLLEHLLSKLGIAIDFTSREWCQIITSLGGFTYSEISTIVRSQIWQYYDKLVGMNTAEIILRHKLTEAIDQFTPYFANFDSLEPATFRFLDQAYGFPRSTLSQQPWEAKFLQRKHELIQTHPNPNIIYRRKHNREL
jgi:AAA+ superfamily predicted ATPase